MIAQHCRHSCKRHHADVCQSWIYLPHLQGVSASSGLSLKRSVQTSCVPFLCVTWICMYAPLRSYFLWWYTVSTPACAQLVSSSHSAHCQPTCCVLMISTLAGSSTPCDKVSTRAALHDLHLVLSAATNLHNGFHDPPHLAPPALQDPDATTRKILPHSLELHRGLVGLFQGLAARPWGAVATPSGPYEFFGPERCKRWHVVFRVVVLRFESTNHKIQCCPKLGSRFDAQYDLADFAEECRANFYGLEQLGVVVQPEHLG